TSRATRNIAKYDIPNNKNIVMQEEQLKNCATCDAKPLLSTRSLWNTQTPNTSEVIKKIEKMRRRKKNTLLTILLLLLWIPVNLDKIVKFDAFRLGILMQPLSHPVAYLVIYSLPVLEILTVFLLVVNRYRRWGFRLSSLLMAAFTAYIGLALLGAWEKLPCGCGSVISGMSWQQHFWFNIFFLSISLVGWYWHKNTGNPPSK